MRKLFIISILIILFSLSLFGCGGEPEKGVSFEGELFGDDINQNFYNYAPTIIIEDDTMHIWYCSNKVSGNVTDYIAYRKGTKLSDGTWKFSEKQLVLEPTYDTWDARHVCDPAVIKGNFAFKGTYYKYLMSYLGCITNDNMYNEVGLAVSNAPEGPWIKIDANPIANFYNSPDFEANNPHWGYGQPSLINIDKSGKVLLFYTRSAKGLTSTVVELWDFSNLDNPIKQRSAVISNRGVVNADGRSDVINNADFAYSPSENRIYCIKEDFDYPEDGDTNWIAGSNTLIYVDLAENENFTGETLFKTFDWKLAGKITQRETGFPRNHNAGIVTDSYGWLDDSEKLSLVYTVSRVRTDFPDWKPAGLWPALHTYRLHGMVITRPD